MSIATCWALFRLALVATAPSPQVSPEAAHAVPLPATVVIVGTIAICAQAGRTRAAVHSKSKGVAVLAISPARFLALHSLFRARQIPACVDDSARISPCPSTAMPGAAKVRCRVSRSKRIVADSLPRTEITTMNRYVAQRANRFSRRGNSPHPTGPRARSGNSALERPCLPASARRRFLHASVPISGRSLPRRSGIDGHRQIDQYDRCNLSADLHSVRSVCIGIESISVNLTSA